MDDISVLDSVKAQVWTDIGNKGSWYTVDMSREDLSDRGNRVARFSVKIVLDAPGQFACKVRFIVEDNGRVIYLPEGFGNNLNITVSGLSFSPIPESVTLSGTRLLNKFVNSAA
jgi:hypothetical protein